MFSTNSNMIKYRSYYHHQKNQLIVSNTQRFYYPGNYASKPIIYQTGQLKRSKKRLMQMNVHGGKVSDNSASLKGE